MSKLVEIGDHGRAVEFDRGDRWFRWIFRRQAEKWVRERFTTAWEWYEASVQHAIREWRPCAQRVAPDDLQSLLTFCQSESPAIDAARASAIVQALQELQERRGIADDLTLINIRESDSRTVLGTIALEVARLLDIPLWLSTTLEHPPENPDSNYARKDDGFRSTEPRTLSIMLLAGRVGISIEGCPSVFFDELHKTTSPRVHRACHAVAEAIRLDNIERPQ